MENTGREKGIHKWFFLRPEFDNRAITECFRLKFTVSNHKETEKKERKTPIWTMTKISVPYAATLSDSQFVLNFEIIVF